MRSATAALASAALVVVFGTALGGRCLTRSFGHGSVVCVCDARQCGALEDLRASPGPAAEDGSSAPFTIFTSSKAGMRLDRAEGNFTNGYATAGTKVGDKDDDGDDYDEGLEDGKTEQLLWSRGRVRIAVDVATQYQTVDGFGGAITDSAAINIHRLQPDVRDVLMRALFAPEGNAYTMLRVPMGGTDDSLRKYTYADSPGDMALQRFRLAEEDIKYKIPVLLNASRMTGGETRVIASAWTAPPWMKTTDQFVGGVLRRDLYQLWADYHVRFLSEYAQRGVAVWALTSGNEPINAFFTPLLIRFNSMGWTPLQQRRWLGRHLGPALRRSPFNATKLLALDDQRMLLPWWLDIVFRDPTVRDLVDGVAVHWYWDIVDPRIGLEATHQHFPEKFIISTEASSADKPWDLVKVQLGSWTRGEKYMTDILKDMNAWVTGWMEWSLVLDTQGGPSWSRNYVDVGVMVDHARQEVLLQPTYYAMAHFSRFVPRGSRRVRLQVERADLSPAGEDQPDEQGLSGRAQVDATAFVTPRDDVVLVLHNSGDSDTSVSIRDPRVGVARVVLPARSFNTLVYSGAERGADEASGEAESSGAGAGDSSESESEADGAGAAGASTEADGADAAGTSTEAGGPAGASTDADAVGASTEADGAGAVGTSTETDGTVAEGTSTEAGGPAGASTEADAAGASTEEETERVRRQRKEI
ncbi:Lysosomal acid glucosylceramidase [Frankliniella fusca]|uniref:Glucosylceramidase n=1 Tax=Frankliniella fusca TaxID=407009 RepID=A0AAE1H5F7_9NEOP|nr:Lysosomal acid glucosylceramidase [Frankliniella fusca]